MDVLERIKDVWKNHNPDSFFSLCSAVWQKRWFSVQYLVEHEKVDVNTPSFNHKECTPSGALGSRSVCTPIYFACRNNDLRMVNYLIQRP